MYTTASVFFKTLADVGITHAFVNWGSDHSAFLEDLQRQRQENPTGATVVEIVTCPSEYVALSAAHGFAQATGRPAAVIVHVDVGTQSLAGAVHNADRGQVPVLIFSGGAPFSANGELKGSKNEYIMWLQDVPDQPAIVRQYMRYTGQIYSGKNAAKVMMRALQIATSQPKGPVYLWARREVTDEVVDEETYNAKLPLTKWPSVTMPALTAEAVDTIITALATAENPLIITSVAGRNPAVVPLFSALAKILAIGVLDVGGSTVNIPYTDPHYLGQVFAGPLPYLPDADVILLVDTEVPWIDAVGNAPREGAKVFMVNNDPLKRNFGFYHTDADLACIADAETALSQLLAAARATSTTALLSPAALTARRTRVAAARAAYVSALASAEAAPSPTPDTVSVPAVLGALRDVARARTRSVGRRVLWLNEAVSACALAWNHIAPDEPGSMFMSGGTSIGWVLGAGVGAALGARAMGKEGGGEGEGKREAWELVVALSGDGNFLFGVPTAAFWAARRYGAPFLAVVLNNGGWGSPKHSHGMVYPDGLGSGLTGEQLAVGFGPDGADYGGVAAAAGGAWARKVAQASALKETFEEAVRVVLEERRCAVVECIVPSI